MQGHMADVRWETLWSPMARTICHRQSFFLAVLEAERCKIWDSHCHLGTTTEKPVHKTTLEDSQGMQESKNTCVYIAVCMCVCVRLRAGVWDESPGRGEKRKEERREKRERSGPEGII